MTGPQFAAGGPRVAAWPHSAKSDTAKSGRACSKAMQWRRGSGYVNAGNEAHLGVGETPIGPGILARP
jgi:hypothetical protein